MCHQTVGLVQAELERRGIVTASISIMPEITRKVAPPRALAVPYGLGFPLGEPGTPAVQRSVLDAMLALCRVSSTPVLWGVLQDRPSDDRRLQEESRPRRMARMAR